MILRADNLMKSYSGRKVVKDVSLEVKQGEIVGLLQSPAKNVLSGLKGAGGKIAGILKTLEER